MLHLWGVVGQKGRWVLSKHEELLCEKEPLLTYGLPWRLSMISVLILLACACVCVCLSEGLTVVKEE